MIKSAGTPEVIRSHQKDDNILNTLKTLSADIAQSCFGPHFWIKWKNHLDLGASVVYFALTTVSDLQTVGEEYVNIIQTDHTLRQLPSKWRRSAMVGLQVCAPYIIQSLLQRFEHQLEHSSSLPISPSTRKTILGILPFFRKVISLTHRLHLAAFYIHGLFYHLSKRTSGIHYIQIASGPSNLHQTRPFQILGYLSLLQITISFVVQAYQVFIALRKKNNLTVSGDEGHLEVFAQQRLSVLPREKCPLCLEKRIHTTLTPCGHLYCWGCIHEWSLSKQECPLCRDGFLPQQLIVLQNYDDDDS